MKKIKLCLIAFFAIVFASMSCAFVATSVKHAEAATADEVKVLKSGVFAMDDSGLTLRTNDKDVGIRFKVKMSKSLGVKIKGSGDDVSLKFLIAPRVVVDSVNGDYPRLVTAAENATEGKVPARICVADKNKMYEDGGYYWASLVIANTTGTNIKLDMNVVAYFTYTDENNAPQTRYATTNVEKVRGNLYNVVNSCAVINGYATDIIGKENFKWYGTEEYPIKIATTKQAEALKEALKSSGVSLSGKTVLSSVDFAGTDATVKTVKESFVDENRQEIVLGGDNDTYPIEGMEAYDGTVEKATIGGVVVNYDNKGNVTLLPEFKNRLAKHGEQILSVTVKGADGNYTEYKKKLLVVTKEISSFEELKAALAFDSNNVKYGYYRLATNLIGYGGYESGNGIGGGIWKNESGDTGFRGTFDGNGLTIQQTFWNTGLFGYIGKGAVIKNITFNVNKYANDKEYMLLGYSMVGATLENVNVNVTPQHGDGRTEIKSNGVSGLLTSIFANGNTFKNVVVDARDTDIDTLFGSCAYYGYTGTDTNTFDKDCKVVAQSLLGLACINNAEGAKKMESAFISGAANLTVAKVGAAKWFNNEIVLPNVTGNDYSVNLEDYTTSATLLPATFGGEAVAYDKGTLTLTDEFKNNTQKHGNRNLCLIAEKDGKYYNVKTQVTVITKEIKTPSDLSVLNGASGDAEYAIYGYYRLANDIGKENYDGINNGSTVTNYVNKGGLIGFRGTFDGNKKSISAKIYGTGIFGIVGTGAVIKDLTVNSYAYSDGKTAFAYSITGATIENVTIDIKSGSSTSYTTGGGVVTATVSHSTTYNNLQVKSENEVDTLFGCSYWSYDVNKANTFVGCTINVKSIGGLICIRAGKPETIVPISGIDGLDVKTAQTA